MRAARLAAGAAGDVMLTLGAVLLLFCVYQLFWSNVAAGRATQSASSAIEQQWTDVGGPDIVVPPSPRAKPATLRIGQGLGFIYIPRLGRDYRKPIVEGIDRPQLAEGVGHYPGTALPGQVGNFAVAGHRATHGEPFRNLDQVHTGDKVVVETKSSWFTFVVDDSEIVSPTSSEVVAPVPHHPREVATQRLMTLTTCHPRWASTFRLIVYTHLVDQRGKAGGPPPALAG